MTPPLLPLPSRPPEPGELFVWLDLLGAVFRQTERAAEGWLDDELTERLRHARRALLDATARGAELRTLHEDLVRELHGTADDAEREVYG